jgi:hypothetical protein
MLQVQVHELGQFDVCSKAYVFRGTKDVTVKELEAHLGLTQQRRMLCCGV